MNTLLLTKIHKPPPQDTILRPRLFQKITGRVTVVAAPPGFGKSTVISQWCAEQPIRSAWVTLDSDDNDPATLLSYTTAALHRVDERIGSHQLALVSRNANPMEALATLINELAALPTPVLLVLDDYQWITSAASHAILNHLVKYMPPTLHLVVISQVEPPLPLSQLRVRGQLSEIRESDLRFTTHEVDLFLNGLMHLSLTREQIQVLDTRTEGWIAALKLAALSLQNEPEAAQFVARFSAQQSFITDYLVDEVISRQPDDVSTFLSATAILDRLCAPLCDAITGQQNGQAMLEHLERHHLFIIPLDNERRWYRYHPLFQDFLRKRTSADQTASHLNAAIWLNANGLSAEAIHHAFAAKAFETAAQWIETTQSLIRDGKFITVFNWINALPDDLRKGRPVLGLMQAWAALGMGQVSSIDPLLAEIDSELDLMTPEMAAYVRQQGDVLRASVFAYHRQDRRAVAYIERAIESLPPNEEMFRSTLTSGLAFAYFVSGDLASAARIVTALREQIEPFSETRYPTSGVLISLLGTQGMIFRARGQLQMTIQCQREALAIAEKTGQMVFGGTLLALYELATALLEQHHVDEARSLLQRYLQLSSLVENPMMAAHGWLAQAQLSVIDGDHKLAQQQVTHALSITDGDQLQFTRQVIEAFQIKLWLRVGNLEAAGNWAAAFHPSARMPERLNAFDVLHLMLAKVWIAQGKIDRALQLVSEVQKSAQASGLGEMLIMALVTEATALHHQHRKALAISALDRALLLAAPEHYVQIFLDEGAVMGDLLRRISGEHKDYAQVLLTYLGDAVPQFQEQLTAAAISIREHEILRLIADGLSNQEIADRLSIALSTTKRHINNLYSKLGVKSRTQALQAARMLGLL